MPRFRNPLVYADGRPESELALAEALKLVNLAEGRATVLDVLHYLPARIPSGLLAMEQEELLALMMEQRREQLHEDVERLRLSSRVDVRVTHGSPAFELIRQAVRGKHDLIVKAARGRDVEHVTTFGSTALHLVRKSPVPVMLMSPHRRLLEAPKIMCALELEGTDVRQTLNHALLEAAAGLATAYSAELHVVHVLDAPRSSVYRSFLSDELFERFCRERQQLLADDLHALVDADLVHTPGVHAHLLNGDPADLLVDFARKQQVSHVVMGSVTRLGPGRLLGNLAEDVLMRMDCTVMTLKPAGFSTPIDVDGTAAA